MKQRFDTTRNVINIYAVIKKNEHAQNKEYYECYNAFTCIHHCRYKMMSHNMNSIVF